jgi:hypothetical protein
LHSHNNNHKLVEHNYALGLLLRPAVLLAGILAIILGITRFMQPDRVDFGGLKVPRQFAALRVTASSYRR